MNQKAKTNLFATITIFLWASAFPFSKVAMEYFSPNTLGALRISAASIFLLILAFFTHIPLPKAKDLYKFFLSGALGFTFYMLTFNMGLQTLTSATSSILMATTPVFTAIFAYFFYQEKISRTGWLAILLEFTGILVLSLWEGVFSVNNGILWTLCTALSFCGYNLYQRKLLAAGYPPLAITVYSLTAGAILFLPLLPKGIQELSGAPLSPVLITIYLGVFPNAVAAFTWGKALLLAKKTSEVTNYMFLTPLLATFLSFFFGESLSSGTIAGGILILCGLLLYQKTQ